MLVLSVALQYRINIIEKRENNHHYWQEDSGNES